MTTSKLADDLETGVNSDIFYDADDHSDDTAVGVIETFQGAVTSTIPLLRKIAKLDLSADQLSPEDLQTLRDVQASIVV
jgi:hypothetical protein